DLAGLVDRIPVGPCADRWKSNCLAARFRCELQAVAVGITKSLRLAFLASTPYRADGVNNMTGTEGATARDDCFAGGASAFVGGGANAFALFQNGRAAGAVYGTIYATTTQ